jgi:phage head maturation protease
MIEEIKLDTACVITRAAMQPQGELSTWNPDTLTAEVVFATDTLCYNEHESIGGFMERLSFAPGHMRRNAAREQAIPLLYGHDDKTIDNHVGTIERIHEPTSNSCSATIRVLNTAQSVIDRFTNKIQKNVSFRASCYKYVKTGEVADGLPVYLCVDWELMEISLVSVPADPHAIIRAYGAYNKIKNNNNMTEVEKKADTQNQELKATIVAETAKKVERNRIETIRGFQTQFPAVVDDEMVSKFIEEGTAVDICRTAVLEKLSSLQPKVKIGNQGDGGHIGEKGMLDAMTTAVLHRLDSRRFGIDFSKNAGFEANPYKHKSFLRLAETMLESRGEPIGSNENSYDIINRAMTTSTRSGMVQADLPNLFSQIIGKTLAGPFTSHPQEWKELCYTEDTNRVNQSVPIIKLGGVGRLDKVNEAGQYAAKNVTDSKETFQVNKFGGEVSITMEMIINDDLGAINRILSDLPRFEKNTEDDLYFDLLLSNPNMNDGLPFLQVGKNAITPAAINQASLEAMYLLASTQVDPSNNRPIVVRPAYILCGSNNAILIERLLTPVLAAKQADVPSRKILGLKVIDTPYITDNRVYMFADTKMSGLAAIRTGGLTGHPGMSVEQYPMQATDSYVYHCRGFFGAAAVARQYICANLGV